MEAGLEARIEDEDWKNAAISAGNLSELTLTLGQVARAVDHARAAVELADRSEDLFQRMSKRTTLGDALHAAGGRDDAASAFRQAEVLQAEDQPQTPKLYSLQGYQYGDLLLSRAAPLDGSALGWDVPVAGDEDARRRCEEVRERSEYALAIARAHGWLLDTALDHLSLGRGHLGLAPASGNDLDAAREPLETAVQGLRAAGHEDDLPRGLLARATLHRFRHDVPAAERDLAEALEIAERGAMKLHACDAHLEWTRLCHAMGDHDDARAHLDAARALVEETGYHRRDDELAALTAALS